MKCLAIALCFFVSVPAFAQIADKIKLTLSFDQAVFIKGEFVHGAVTAENLTSETITIPSLHPFTGGIDFKVWDDSFQPLRYRGFIFWGEDAMVQLPPGGKISEQIELRNEYGNDPETHGPQIEFKEGRYTAQATLRDATSNEVEFHVTAVPPHEIDVHKFIQRRGWHDPGFKDNLAQMIADHENSVYLPNMLVTFWVLLENGDETNLRSIRDSAYEFIRRFPDSPFCNVAIDFYANAIEKQLALKTKSPVTRSQLAPYMNKIKNEFRQHRVADLIDPFLKKYFSDYFLDWVPMHLERTALILP